MRTVHRSGGSAINQTRPSPINDSFIYAYFNALQAIVLQSFSSFFFFQQVFNL